MFTLTLPDLISEEDLSTLFKEIINLKDLSVLLPSVQLTILRLKDSIESIRIHKDIPLEKTKMNPLRFNEGDGKSLVCPHCGSVIALKHLKTIITKGIHP